MSYFSKQQIILSFIFQRENYLFWKIIYWHKLSTYLFQVNLFLYNFDGSVVKKRRLCIRESEWKWNFPLKNEKLDDLQRNWCSIFPPRFAWCFYSDWRTHTHTSVSVECHNFNDSLTSQQWDVWCNQHKKLLNFLIWKFSTIILTWYSC